MTTNNITSATIIIELDNGEYAATSTTSRAVIELSKCIAGVQEDTKGNGTRN